MVGTHLPFTCREVEACAAALLDAQLSPSEEEMVEEHLERCDSCADLVDAMDAQRIKPPRIQLIQQNDYWEEMDAVLQSELDRAETDAQSPVSKQMMVFYAAVLLLSVMWGWHHKQRANHLERIVYTQQQTLEQLERVSNPSLAGQNANASYRPAKMEL